jgi:two-component system, OmpR family, response regulator
MSQLPETEFAMNKARVLLVDDEVAFANNLHKLLSKRGYATTVANDGESALRVVEENDFDVIVLDLKMPGLDGIETLKQVKRRKPFVEVIILTGHGSVDSGIEGMQHGAFDYAMKPIVLEDLLERISEAHERKLMHEEGRGES